jgi:hypothetical protein
MNTGGKLSQVQGKRIIQLKTRRNDYVTYLQRNN